MYNYARTHTPYGATLAQIQTLGANYALNGKPLSQAYTGFNVDKYYTDFDYLGLKSAFGDGWGIDDKLYTVSYFHNGTAGLDPNGTTPNLNGTYFLNGVRTAVINHVPGYAKATAPETPSPARTTSRTAWTESRSTSPKGLLIRTRNGTKAQPSKITSPRSPPNGARPAWLPVDACIACV